jgi:hypothetical protein
MSEPKDVLNQLARLATSQAKPPRSARDLAVLEAAKAKAVMNKQIAIGSAKKAEPFWRFLNKPMWLGTGSLAAAALSVFIVFGHQVAPDEKVASAPVSAVPAAAPAAAPTAAPTAAPLPALEVASNRDEVRASPATAAKRDAVPPKKESPVQSTKKVGCRRAKER